ncbi:hypothetical protein [Phaeobacter sp.]|uniref:hypothetical protein n=1 Tax=Phaeobacter sp. TaxID=1902409 RepID=UPI0025F75957|nr:hypothetical protein [Phaeobacter sp.]
MSDPVTQNEIEDVLSSIRRLVSEDTRGALATSGKAQRHAAQDAPLHLGNPLAQPIRPAQPVKPVQPIQSVKPVPSAPAGTCTNMPGGTVAKDTTDTTERQKGKAPVTRLVLTPALRVPEDRLTPADTPNTQVEAVEADPTAPWDLSALHDRDAENQDLVFFNQLTAAAARDEAEETLAEAAPADDFPATGAIEAQTEVAETEPVETDPLQAEPAAVYTDTNTGTVAEEQPAEILDPDAPWTSPGATLFQAAGVSTGATTSPTTPPQQATALNPKVGAVVQKLAEMEAANVTRPVLWEPDGSRDTPYAGTDLEAMDWPDGDSDMDGDRDGDGSAPAAGADHQNGPDAVAEPTTDQMATDTNAERSPEPASALASAPAAAPTPQADQDETVAAEPAATGLAEALSEQVTDHIASQVVDAAEAGETVLDEDGLRALVVDIVRAELQGALGERITRNVRKLVRREIKRALAAQDLL